MMCDTIFYIKLVRDYKMMNITGRYFIYIFLVDIITSPNMKSISFDY